MLDYFDALELGMFISSIGIFGCDKCSFKLFLLIKFFSFVVVVLLFCNKLLLRGGALTSVIGVIALYSDWPSVVILEGATVCNIGNDYFLFEKIVKMSLSLVLEFGGPLNLFKKKLIVGLGFNNPCLPVYGRSDSLAFSSLTVATIVFLPFLLGELI